MGISKRVYQRLRLIGYGTVPDFFCCSAEYRQQINRRTQPSQNRTIPRKSPTPLPPLSKVRCCRPKKFGRLPEELPHQPSPRTNPSKNRTIPLAFRRMSVCVCLVGFASLQSTWAHTLRHPCLACSSRCTEYCHSHNNCKKTIIPQKSPSHLPPLSKVRCCRPKKFGRLPEGLSHHPLPLHQPFQNRTIARKALSPLPLNERFVGFASMQSLWAFISGILALLCTITLASPRKRGGGLTASQNRYST